MTISSLKELKQLMKLCREQRIDTIKIDNIEFRIELAPETPKPRNEAITAPKGVVTEDTPINEGLTQEQILMWSAAPGGGQ